METVTEVALPDWMTPTCHLATDKNHVSFYGQWTRECLRRQDEGEAVDLDTGELRPLRCGSNSCPSCVSVKRWQVARAVKAADPSHEFTLTLAGDEFSTIRDKMKALRKSLLRHGHAVDWCWVVECNETEYPVARHFHHVQGFMHGNIPDEGTFRDLALRAGFGFETQVRPIRDLGEAIGYLFTKKAKRWYRYRIAHHLDMQGGRVELSSRGFWRVNGERVAGRDEAIRLTRASVPPGEAETTPNRTGHDTRSRSSSRSGEATHPQSPETQDASRQPRTWGTADRAPGNEPLPCPQSTPESRFEAPQSASDPLQEETPMSIPIEPLSLESLLVGLNDPIPEKPEPVPTDFTELNAALNASDDPIQAAIDYFASQDQMKVPEKPKIPVRPTIVIRAEDVTLDFDKLLADL